MVLSFLLVDVGGGFILRLALRHRLPQLKCAIRGSLKMGARHTIARPKVRCGIRLPSLATAGFQKMQILRFFCVTLASFYS